MSSLILYLIGFFCLISEATWLHRAAILDIMPNLTLILVVYWGILQGSQKGRRLGLWMGLLQDLLFCRAVGFYGMLYYGFGHISGYLNHDFYQGHFILPLTAVTGLDLVYGLLHYLIFCFFQGDLNIGFYWQQRIIPEICYTAMISVPLYPLMRLLSKSITRMDLWLKSGKGH